MANLHSILPATKTCCYCKKELQLSEFSRDATCKDGLKYDCKSCSKRRRKGLYKAPPYLIQHIELEDWKDVVGYEGIYQISNKGRIKRLAGSERCLTDRLLVQKTKKNGYRFVCLSTKERHVYFHVHRLVAIAFIPNQDGKSQVNHRDLNKTNNCVENLEWCSNYENMAHAHSLKTWERNSKKGIEHPKSKKVYQFTLNGSFIKEWDTAKDAALHYQCSQTNIAGVCRGGRGRKTSMGFHWSYRKSLDTSASVRGLVIL